MPYVEYDETEAVCPHCGSAFRSAETLEAHVRESHEGESSAAGEGRPKEVACSVCGAHLPSITALERHNRTAHIA